MSKKGDRKNKQLTSKASWVLIFPVCQTLVIVPRAGMPAYTMLPLDCLTSSSVGSSHISLPTMH